VPRAGVGVSKRFDNGGSWQVGSLLCRGIIGSSTPVEACGGAYAGTIAPRRRMIGFFILRSELPAGKPGLGTCVFLGFSYVLQPFSMCYTPLPVISITFGGARWVGR